MKKSYSVLTILSLLASPLAQADETSSATLTDTPATPVPRPMTETTPPPPSPTPSKTLPPPEPVPTPTMTQPIPTDTPPLSETTLTTPDTTDMPLEEGTPVSHASKDSSKSARHKTWQNIGLAVAAVAVAVAALILVSNNSGHHK